MRNFHSELMADELFKEREPLHLRRTLDQFYYVHTADTTDRDGDQVLSKYGPGTSKAGERPILMVDQLWLWILGPSTNALNFLIMLF